MKPPSLDDERLRRDFAAPRDRARRSAGCPGDNEIWDASRGELEAVRARELLEHASTCAACQESWRMAREVAVLGGAGSAEPADGGQAEGRSRGKLVIVGIVAAAVVALVMFVPLGDGSHDDPVNRLRGGSSYTIESLVDEGTSIDRSDCVLRWTSGPPGTLYRFEMALEDLTVVARAEELEAARYRVPPDALADLPSGTRLLWRVDALLPDTTRTSSPVFRVTLD